MMTRGEAGRSLFPESYQGFTGWRSPQERALIDTPMSEEEYIRFLNGQNSRKERQLRITGDIAEAERRNRFLNTVSPGEVGMIHEAPQDERQAMLQQYLNEDFLARENGARASMNSTERNRQEYLHTILPLRLQMARYNQTNANSNFNKALSMARLGDARSNEKARRQRAAQQSEALEDYRGDTLGMRADEFANRVQNQQQNRQFQQTQAGIRNKRADANQNRNSFIDAINAMKNGASAAEMDQAFSSMWPSLTPAQQNIASAFMQQRAQQASVADAVAERYNNLLSRAPELAGTGNGQDIRNQIDGIITRASRDPQARGFIIYDPNRRSFIPNPRYGGVSNRMGTDMGASTGAGGMLQDEPSYDQEDYGDGMIDPEGNFVDALPPARPQPQAQSQPSQRSSMRDGLYQGPDGYVYRVVNGMPQRTNLRRRR